MHKTETKIEAPLLYAKLEDETDKKKLTWQKATFALLVFFLVGLVAWRVTRPADASALNMDLNDVKVGAATVAECMPFGNGGPGNQATTKFKTPCKCGDTAECKDQYCVQPNANAKMTCQATPQCTSSMNVTAECVCG